MFEKFEQVNGTEKILANVRVRKINRMTAALYGNATIKAQLDDSVTVDKLSSCKRIDYIFLYEIAFGNRGPQPAGQQPIPAVPDEDWSAALVWFRQQILARILPVRGEVRDQLVETQRVSGASLAADVQRSGPGGGDVSTVFAPGIVEMRDNISVRRRF